MNEFAEFLFRRGEVKQSVARLLPVRVVEGSTADLAARSRAYPAFLTWFEVFHVEYEYCFIYYVINVIYWVYIKNFFCRHIHNAWCLLFPHRVVFCELFLCI